MFLVLLTKFMNQRLTVFEEQQDAIDETISKLRTRMMKNSVPLNLKKPATSYTVHSTTEL